MVKNLIYDNYIVRGIKRKLGMIIMYVIYKSKQLISTLFSLMLKKS